MNKLRMFRSDVFSLLSKEDIKEEDIDMIEDKIFESGIMNGHNKIKGKECINPLTNEKDQIMTFDSDLYKEIKSLGYNTDTSFRIWCISALILSSPIVRKSGMSLDTIAEYTRLPYSTLKSLDGRLGFKIGKRVKQYKLRNRIKEVEVEIIFYNRE